MHVINKAHLTDGNLLPGSCCKIYLWISMLTSCINYDDFIAREA
ncbi:hypothetical protein UUU_08510 [Klebsiella pneumoniae subsp. pneumoniae DSM 30104 = JCM 1662 = NBRC 14940]|nr:hypothetical protein KP13_32129 [Klebsiella pneumoniae subsp. pneumoniae Kp13]EGF60757.1 hypothetical protein HMPREF9538_04844 [Klebsiella sp. MS 92-3]EJK92245.1 hypothetical protein UUU_08510 [Klebsiella pneumoniae subsp. pneumoniae DSM 30104 = JCM 1662 = NBRC 14940]